MKLAEALQERADLNRRIEQLRVRLNNNALVQDGEIPAEDPKELLRELDDDIERLEELIARINLANSRTERDGITLTEMIATKDTLTQKLSVYRDFAETASQTAYRARNTEIRILSTVNIAAIQKKIDNMAKELRTINNTIQEMNWTTEI